MRFFRQLFSSQKRPYIPGLKQSENIKMNLSGTQLKMRLPYHTPFDHFDKVKQAPKFIDLHNANFINPDEHRPNWQKSGASGLSVLRRSLGFLAPPWYTSDRYGQMEFSIGVGRINDMPKAMSLFNPQHLEQATIRNAYFSGPAQPTQRHTTAPVNWRVKETEAGTWLYYELLPCPNACKANPEEAAFITTLTTIPIGHRYFLSLGISGAGWGFYPNLKHYFKHFHKIKNAVLNSVYLRLGEHAYAQLCKAQKQWPHANATKNHATEPWVYPIWRNGDYEKGEPEIVILKEGSPAPIFSL